MSGTDELSDNLIQRGKQYKSIILKIYSGNNQGIVESEILGELLKYLSEIPINFHLFCNPIVQPISIFCLTVFSFTEQDTVNWLKNKFNPILQTCQDCILQFTRGKCRMLQHFAIERHVPHEHVSKFNDIVCQWRIESLAPVIRDIKVVDNIVQIDTHLQMAIYELICNPHILRLNKNLKDYFDVLFKYLYNSKHFLLNFDHELGIKIFLPGIIYCWCEGSIEEIKWATSILKKFHNNKFTISAKELTADILQEIYFHFLFLQNPSNWNETIISQFWMRFLPIFNIFETDVFLEYFVVPKNIESLKQNIKYPIESIFVLWYNHMVKNFNNKPLGILLRALKFFLDRLNQKFWDRIEPFTFHNILDSIFENNTFAINLIKLENVPLPANEIERYFSEGSMTDLISWTLPFYHSLSVSKRIQMVKKVSMAFLRIIANNPTLKALPKACLMNSSTALLCAVLNISEEQREQLYINENFQTILFTKTDSRTLLNNPLLQNIVLRSATHPNEFYPDLGDSASSVAKSAMIVLTKCIDFDILLLCQRTFKLYNGKTISDLPMPLNLLENLTNELNLTSFHDGPLLAKELLISLRNINGLLPIPSKSESIIKHNETVNIVLKFTTKLIDKFSDILPKQLSLILADKEASKSFWSCIFSSNTQLYQSATNILYETFDVEGRLEGIQALMKTSLSNQINAINAVLRQLVICEFYEPCPRAVRVLMDIVSAFNDPVSGILSNYSTLKNSETDEAFKNFWGLFWAFLDTIYRCTLNWAAKYDYSELENFTKDTLELSRSLIGSFREISDILDDTSIDLFDSVLKTFNNMLYWLRLSDEELLDSCVKLIISTSDLAKEKNKKFDDHLVEQMAKYGSKSKKFSNKLTENQTYEILSKAKLFNNDIVDRVLKEAEIYREEKELAKQKTKQQNIVGGKLNFASESKADFLQRKATSSSLMGRPKASQPKITAFGSYQPLTNIQLHKAPVKPISRMEQARRNLLNNRVIHPPSSSVFNTKPAMQRSVSSSDESDDEVDIESARELFAVAKSKSKQIETLDINGKLIKKDSSAERKKMEEEYMRKRLHVDMNPLYETILQWDYTRNDEYPKDSNINNYSDIRDEFKSATEYYKVMKPLLLLECWQGLCSARDREDYKPFSIVVGNRTAVSDFYEVYTSVSKQMLQDSGVSESDLIVLASFPSYRPGERLTSNDFKHVEHTCLAKIRSLKYSKGNAVDVTLRIHRDHKFFKFLTIRAEIHAVKVMQMTTVEREYQTLEGLEYYDLVSQILTAKPSPPLGIPKEEVELVKTNYKLNTSQAEAIVNTVITKGFSLIQGPPGTGKTKTILGIIGYFLSTRQALPSNVIKYPGESNSNQSLEQLLKKQKVLICAPSNAAVDEICLRLKDGLYKKDGDLFRPNIVRVGRSDAVNSAIKDLTLEELVERKLGEKNFEFTQNPELDRTFNAAVTKRRQLRDQLNAEDGSPTSKLSNEDIAKLQLEVRKLSKEINEMGKQRDEIRERNSVNYRSRDLHRRNTQMQILAGSDIICSTLSGSAHDVLASLGIKFDTVIIDEACQCTELSSIIPLRYGATRCIMVGDPNQLPPTVLSGAASNFKYNQSLFVRMTKSTIPYLLNVQYRMHPSISKFPSREFYGGKLRDGPDMALVNRRPWHASPILGPYKFFDILTGRQEQNVKTMSYTNSEEIKVALELIDSLFRKFDEKVDFAGKIGIISPYREQMVRMRREFVKYFGGSISKFIDFNTIDGFQGQEKEIIIISCVRADETKSSVGFLKDFRRMNVAFTRAKTSMWILGHQKSLTKNKLWNNLIEDARERNCIEEVSPGFLSNRKSPKPYITKEFDSVNKPTSATAKSVTSKPVSSNTSRANISKKASTSEKYLTSNKQSSATSAASIPSSVKPVQKSVESVSKKSKDVNEAAAKPSSEESDQYDPLKHHVPIKRHRSSADSSPFIKKKVFKKRRPDDGVTPAKVTGTKKKSSFFGKNTDVMMDKKSDMDKKQIFHINDGTKKKEVKSRTRHISFSDDATVIVAPENLKKLPHYRDMPDPKSKIYKKANKKHKDKTKKNKDGSKLKDESTKTDENKGKPRKKDKDTNTSGVGNISDDYIPAL